MSTSTHVSWCMLLSSVVRMVNATDGIMCHALLVPSSPVPDARLMEAHHRRSFMMLNAPVVELSHCGVRTVLVEEHPGASRTNNHKECKNGSRYRRRESSQPRYEEIADIHAIKQASTVVCIMVVAPGRNIVCLSLFGLLHEPRQRGLEPPSCPTRDARKT